MFADLAGSTSLQERMDAERVRRVMDGFYTAMSDAVTAHGGTIVKFMGDGLMAAFGVPTVAEDDAARAVRAAAAMQTAFTAIAGDVGAEGDVRLGLRVGVNTGEVVVTDGVDDVLGDAVNVAARLEHAAALGQVLVGQETWRLTRGLFTFEAVPPLDLKGKSQPVPGYRLVSLGTPAGDTQSPFVGREMELARITAAFEAADGQRRARLVTVVGSPGLGKTRLVRELVQRLGTRAQVFEGQCEPGGALALGPVADMLRTAAGFDETASADDAVRAFLALFPDSAEDAGRVSVAAATVVGTGGGIVSPEETLWGIRRVVEQLAHRRPTVLVFDDIHWGQPLLLDLLEHLAEWTRDSPLLLVALARPEIRDVRAALADPGGKASDVIVLHGLPDVEVARLASELLDGHDLEEGLAARLLQWAEGNPLFIRELVKMLLEEGALRVDGGRWVVAEGADVDVPPTIHALLSARIERLGPDERSVIERASVVGHQFFRGAVAVLSPPPVASKIDAHLETLRRKEMVEPEGTYWVDEPVFRFHHALIRDAAYRRLLKEARADLHERIADWLETKTGQVVAEHHEVIGYHLEQAHAYRRDLGRAEGLADLGVRAASHLGTAARRALERDDLRSAAGLIGRALACLPADDPSRAELLVLRCEALLGLGDVAGGVASLAELETLAQGSPRLVAWAETFAAQVASFSEPGALHDWVARAAGAADRLDELGDRGGAAKASTVHASILARLGQVAACEAALDRALGAAREAGDRRRANAVLGGAPLAALWGPSPVSRAAGRCLDVVRVLRITTDSPAVEAVALQAQGVLESFRGRFDAARRLVAASRRRLEELGLRHGIFQADLSGGLVELVAGEPAAAEAFLRRAYDGLRSLGVGVDAAQAGALLARACLALGRDDEALQLTVESERLGGHDLKAAIAWRAARAEALARRGQMEEALALAREAVAIAAGTDALVDHADARLALAAVLATAGEHGEARDEARRAAALYEAKDASALAEHARAMVGGTPEDGNRPEAPPEMEEVAEPASSADAENVVVAAWRQYQVLFQQHDVDAILATVSSDYVLEERQYHAHSTSRGREGFRELLTAIFEGEFTRVECDVLATRGRDLALVRVVWHVRSRSGGDIEVAHLRVDEAGEDGLLVRSVAFDGDDFDAAHDQLDEWFISRVEPSCRPIVETAARSRRAYNARDWDTWLESFTDDFVLVDHRPAGWGTCDAGMYLERVLGLVELAPDLSHQWTDIHALTPQWAVGRVAARGTDSQGGRFDVELHAVSVVRDGKVARMEFYAGEERWRALARYEQLVGLHVDATDPAAVDARFEELTAEQPEPSAVAGNLAVEAWARARERMCAGDLAGILAVCAPDVLYEERKRPPARFTLTGREALGEMLRVMVAHGGWKIDTDVVATRGTRLALTDNTFHYDGPVGGRTEYTSLRLDETDESGLLVATVIFEVDDVAAAHAEIDSRYRALVDQTCRPFLDLSDRLQAAYDARDVAAYRALLRDDFVVVDHRPAGWGTLGPEEYCAHLSGLFSVVTGMVEVRQLEQHVTPHGGFGRTKATATGTEGTPVEIAFYGISLAAGGLISRMEFFPVDARAAAWSRFEELMGTT